jgi:hypothetical protein
MESILSTHVHPNNAPCHPYIPSPVTTSKLETALNEIEVEHQKNADFLKNPHPGIEPNDFHKQASTGHQLAQDLCIWESSSLPLAQNNLAHGQEVILYGTSCLHTVVMA